MAGREAFCWCVLFEFNQGVLTKHAALFRAAPGARYGLDAMLAGPWPISSTPAKIRHSGAPNFCTRPWPMPTLGMWFGHPEKYKVSTVMLFPSRAMACNGFRKRAANAAGFCSAGESQIPGIDKPDTAAFKIFCIPRSQIRTMGQGDSSDQCVKRTHGTPCPFSS